MNRKHLVLAGGGHSHLFVLRAFARQPLTDVSLTLVSPHRFTPYSGALSAWMCGQADESAIFIDLQKLVEQAGARLITAAVTSIDARHQTLQLENGEMLDWDVLSLNTGSTPDLSGIDDAEAHACPVKPIDGFMTQWKALLKQISEQPEKALDIAFIGAGVAGSELALTAANFLESFHSGHRVHLFADSMTPVPGMPSGFQHRLIKALTRARVKLHTGASVSRLFANGVITGEGIQRADYCFITTSAAAPAWTTGSGLTCDPDGFVLASDTLQSVTNPAVFAAGDIASLHSAPLPKSGVYAVRMGPLLASNLRSFLQGKPVKPFRPQKQTLALLHTGRRSALATRGHWSSQGYAWWVLKHWLDRRFIRLFS